MPRSQDAVGSNARSVDFSAVFAAGLAIAAVLVKIMPPAGTIVIEVNQPELVGAEVSIDGRQRLTIRSADSKDPSQQKHRTSGGRCADRHIQ